jgi:hypothetical protein
MAETSWPSPAHNSRAVSDREYELLVSGYSGDALLGSPSDTPIVYADGASGLAIKVRPDRYGLVRAHMWYSGTVEYSISITANASGAVRQDLVVLKLDRATWNVTMVVKTGTAGAGIPALTQDLGTTGVFEIPVAVVRITSGTVNIGASDVTILGAYLAEPLLFCTSASRPTAINGRRIFETNTGLQYIAVGTTWFRVPDERTGMGELGPYTIPNYTVTGTGQVVLFDQVVACRPSHYHNLATRLLCAASTSYSHITVVQEIDTVAFTSSGATLVNGMANVPAELNFTGIGWKSGAAQTSFRLRVLVQRYSGGTLSGSGGAISIVDHGAGAGSGAI